MAERRVVVLVGAGNNGGDGLVAAQHLHEWGAEVRCYALKRRDDALWQHDLEMGIPCGCLEDDNSYEELEELLAGADCVIDALLGTGHARPITGALAAILERLAAARARARAPKLVAVDLPTGVDADNGHADPLTVTADITVTFHAPKVGLYVEPGASLAGRVETVEIGIPAGLDAEPQRDLLDRKLAKGFAARAARRCEQGHVRTGADTGRQRAVSGRGGAGVQRRLSRGGGAGDAGDAAIADRGNGGGDAGGHVLAAAGKHTGNAGCGCLAAAAGSASAIRRADRGLRAGHGGGDAGHGAPLAARPRAAEQCAGTSARDRARCGRAQRTRNNGMGREAARPDHRDAAPRRDGAIDRGGCGDGAGDAAGNGAGPGRGVGLHCGAEGREHDRGRHRRTGTAEPRWPRRR